LNRQVDRKRIARGFDLHAGEYDRHAVVQKRVVSALDRLVSTHLSRAPGRLLDIGCGTGAVLSAMAGRYPAAQLCGVDLAFNMCLKASGQFGAAAQLVNGDAECLPFLDGSFDLIVSASTLQWVQGLDSCFKECLRVLAPGGLLCAAFFGGGTLRELQESYQEALSNRFEGDLSRRARLQRFKSKDEVRQVLEDLGFNQVVIAMETELDYHADVGGLLRSIKGIGASTTARNDAGGGLGWRGVLSEMSRIYRSRYERDGMIPATYEVIYIVARRDAVISPAPERSFLQAGG